MNTDTDDSGDSAQTALMALYGEGGRPPKEVAKELKRNEAWAFPSPAMEEVLAAVQTGDPDFKRTRSFVHELADDHRLGLHAVKFGARVTAPVMPQSVKPWPPRIEERSSRRQLEPAHLLEEISTELGPKLRRSPGPGDPVAQLEARRAHNALMLVTEYLSVALGLAAEEAVPILTAALGSAKQVAKDRPNPRRVRMRALTDSNLGRERIREILEVLQPWITQLDEREEQIALATERAARLGSDLDKRSDQLAEATARNGELTRELQNLRGEMDELIGRYRDSGVKANSDVRQIRGRVAAHLESRLRTKLDTASEALGVETPRISVANRMVAEAIEELEGELKWLRSSD